MNRLVTLVLSALMPLLISCSQAEPDDGFALRGVWMLENRTNPEGWEQQFSQDNISWLRIYDDTCYYECQTIVAPSGKMIVPSASERYTLIERGNHDYLYLQGEHTRPLTVISDSCIVIQERGSRYTWKTCHSYDDDRVRTLVGIIRNDVDSAAHEPSHRYIFSYAEQKLQTINHTLIYSLAFALLALMAIANYSYLLYRNKKRVEQELRQIEQEHVSLPVAVREAMNSVEEDFHQSDFYLSLRKKIAHGERLNVGEWNEIEERFKSVYPRFTSTLLTLHNMSETELRVCQLLKLNATPTEIANVLCKDTSSISSIRSRLYKKVFDKKGSSKEWDEFIHSL